ncbi:MAG: HEAT repeat domain-containing protein [Phycisphaerales bacterium JB060]
MTRSSTLLACVGIGLVVSLSACAGGGAGSAVDAGPRPGAVELSQTRERAIEQLEEMAGHPDPVIRGNALEALLDAPGRAGVWLERGLSDESPGVRAVALTGIGQSRRSELAEQARPLLGDQSPWVRLSAAYALAANGDTSGMQEIVQALMGSDVPRLRAQAAFVLGELGNRSALPLLHDAVAKPMPMAQPSQVRLMSLQMSEAMVKLGDAGQIQPIRAALYPARAEDLEATALAARVLGEVGDHASESQLAFLTARLDDQGNMLPPEVRLSAVYALAQLGKTQGDTIAMAYLDDSRGSVRGLSALTLGEIGNTRHLDVIEPLMEDPDPSVRVHASAAVVRLTRP